MTTLQFKVQNTDAAITSFIDKEKIVLCGFNCVIDNRLRTCSVNWVFP